MSNLVDGSLLLPVEFTVCTHRIFLKEEADLVARRQEILVSYMVVVSRRELGLLLFSLNVKAV